MKATPLPGSDYINASFVDVSVYVVLLLLVATYAE